MDNWQQKIEEWQYLQTLPENLYGFSLRREGLQCGTSYRIFTYAYEELHRSFSVLYDEQVQEFTAKIVVGLTEYNDLDFIVPSVMELEKALTLRLDRTVRQLGRFDEQTLCVPVRHKKICEWDYIPRLPENYRGFCLYIRPDQPLRFLNGSYIILDYTDFQTENSLLVYYNIFRDEFFAEIRRQGILQLYSAFDSKTLPELAEKMDAHLIAALQSIAI